MRLLCDADELLLDLQTPINEAIFETTGRRFFTQELSATEMLRQLPFEDAARVVKKLEEPRFCLSCSANPRAFEALDEIRKHAEVIALISPLPFISPHWLRERVNWLTQIANFSFDDVRVTSRKATEDGDIMLARRGPSLKAWKELHPRGTALLWHDPFTVTGLDEPAWTGVWDWRVVEWFTRADTRRLAACS